MKKTMLEIAKGIKTKERVTESNQEELDLVVAVLNNIVTVRAAAKAMKLDSPGSFSHRVGKVLRWGIENEKIVIKPITK